MDPYLGEIRMFGGTFAPRDWAFCNGQLLPISQNDALYALLGTTYGGDGVTTFGVPNLQGRLPLHTSPQYPLGGAAGNETVTLLTTQLPNHTHQAMAVTTAADQSTPVNNMWATTTNAAYSTGASGGDLGTLNVGAINVAGQSQPHENMQPFVAVSFIISLQGIFPTQS